MGYLKNLIIIIQNPIDFDEDERGAGTIVEIGCKNSGEDFDFGDNINRLIFECVDGR